MVCTLIQLVLASSNKIVLVNASRGAGVETRGTQAGTKASAQPSFECLRVDVDLRRSLTNASTGLVFRWRYKPKESQQ